MGLPTRPDSPPAPCPAPSFLNDPARLPHASLPLNSSPLCSQRLALRWRTPARPAEPSWRVPSPCKSFWVHADQAGFTRVSSWSSQSSPGDIKLGGPWVSWSHWTRRSRSAAETGLAPSRGPAKPSEMDKGQQNHHRVPFTLTLEHSALSPAARTPQFTGPFNVPTRSLPTGGQVGGISPILQMVGGIKVTEAGKTTQDSGLPAEWKPTLL